MPRTYGHYYILTGTKRKEFFHLRISQRDRHYALRETRKSQKPPKHSMFEKPGPYLSNPDIYWKFRILTSWKYSPKAWHPLAIFPNLTLPSSRRGPSGYFLSPWPSKPSPKSSSQDGLCNLSHWHTHRRMAVAYMTPSPSWSQTLLIRLLV
jgi:hypothetical protein